MVNNDVLFAFCGVKLPLSVLTGKFFGEYFALRVHIYSKNIIFAAFFELLTIITSYRMNRLYTLLFALIAMAAGVNAASKTVKLSTGAQLVIFTADAAKANGRGIIVCPGGGYSYLASDKEGTQWADFLNNLGYTIAVLNYRMPKTHSEWPLADGRAALAYMRENADELMVFPNHVGVMGFSAGGHLASTIATHTEGDERPAFQILFYPVITMEKGKTHQGSIDELLGTNPSAELVEQFSNQNHVDGDAPVAYITYSDNDGTVPPATNGKVYYDALVAAGVPAELHTYPTGGHGWGGGVGEKLGSTCQAQMQQHFTAWLKALGQYLPAVEVDEQTTSLTIDADATTAPTVNYLRMPNLNTLVVNSDAVARKNYTAGKNLGNIYGPNIATCVFGEGVTSLGNYIMAHDAALASVSLPSTLEKIGLQAFASCSQLAEIDIPAAVTEVGQSAFSSSGLTAAVLPGVKTIKSQAFAQCRQLESVELGADVDTIYANAFKGCEALRRVQCGAAVPPGAAASFIEESQKAQATLVVPAGSRDAYLAAEAWSGFGSIEESGQESGVKAVGAGPAGHGEAYGLDGRRIADRGRRAVGVVIRDGRKVLE